MTPPNKEARLAELIGELSDAHSALSNDLQALLNAEQWVKGSREKVAEIEGMIKKLQ